MGGYLVNKCVVSVEQKGSIKFNGERVEGATPLWCAAAIGHFYILKLLVESGANVNSANSMGQTCLMIACKKGHFATVKYLLEKGADLNRKTDKGKDAFDECRKSGPIMDVLRLMSEERMNQERIDFGMNLLQLAAVNGHQDTVEHIIRYTELVGKQKEIDALELLGAALIDNNRHDWGWAGDRCRATPRP